MNFNKRAVDVSEAVNTICSYYTFQCLSKCTKKSALELYALCMNINEITQVSWACQHIIDGKQKQTLDEKSTKCAFYSLFYINGFDSFGSSRVACAIFEKSCDSCVSNRS